MGLMISLFLGSQVFWSCSPLVFPSAKVTLRVSPQTKSPNYRAQALDPGFCYALNITGPYPGLQSDPYVGASCPGGTGGVGLAAGLYNVGDEALLDVPAGGGIKFDLIAFPKNGSCSGAFNLVASAPGEFAGYLNGNQISTAPRWVATTVATVVPGLNEITLDPLPNESATTLGQPYTCGQAPVLSVISQTSPDTFVIQGNHLAGTNLVQLTGPSTIPLTVTSASPTQIVATVGQAAQAILGQAYNLIVANAFGQTSSQVFLTLAPGSITPAHLDLTQTGWPFIPVKFVGSSQIQALSSFTPVSAANILNLTGSVGGMFDNSITTGLFGSYSDTLSPSAMPKVHSVLQLGTAPKALKIFAKASLVNISSTGDVSIRCKFQAGPTISSGFSDMYAQSQLVWDPVAPGNNKLTNIIKFSLDSVRYLDFACDIEEDSGATNMVDFDVLISELRVFEEDPF